MRKTTDNNIHSKVSIHAAAAQLGSLPVDLREIDFPEKQEFALMADYAERALQTEEGKEIEKKRLKESISREEYSEGIWEIAIRLAKEDDEKTKQT